MINLSTSQEDLSFSYKRTGTFKEGQVRLLTMEVTSVSLFNILGLTYSEKKDKLLLLSTWHLQQPGQRIKCFV